MLPVMLKLQAGKVQKGLFVPVRVKATDKGISVNVKS